MAGVMPSPTGRIGPYAMINAANNQMTSRTNTRRTNATNRAIADIEALTAAMQQRGENYRTQLSNIDKLTTLFGPELGMNLATGALSAMHRPGAVFRSRNPDDYGINAADAFSRGALDVAQREASMLKDIGAAQSGLTESGSRISPPSLAEVTGLNVDATDFGRFLQQRYRPRGAETVPVLVRDSTGKQVPVDLPATKAAPGIRTGAYDPATRGEETPPLESRTYRSNVGGTPEQAPEPQPQGTEQGAVAPTGRNEDISSQAPSDDGGVDTQMIAYINEIKDDLVRQYAGIITDIELDGPAVWVTWAGGNRRPIHHMKFVEFMDQLERDRIARTPVAGQ